MAKAFGDVFSYDATFCVNRYKMPFTPFVGVNHHGSSVVLAAALISHEDAGSFTWVFRRWLDCMGRAPSVILTDHCKGISKAVKDVFTNTHHRLCLWHIMVNATKNLGSFVRYQEIIVDLWKIIDDSADSDDFEEAWHHFVAKYGLHENGWIIDSFQNRHSWVPLYWRDIFCVGMSSTQRSEQTNRFFKTYVNVETTLFKFFDSYQNALRSNDANQANDSELVDGLDELVMNTQGEGLMLVRNSQPRSYNYPSFVNLLSVEHGS
ncbi:protein FAR1-RELATED SEQUENCE 5-like [Silene latifolia]|uniref:protein FAR1-RELATED SEQUENCE 5-like n=1 Tax=Silene latifolia TaxID=37657 RepID=UPI003D77EB52